MANEGRKNIHELYSAFLRPVYRGLRFPSVHAQAPTALQPSIQGQPGALLVSEIDVQNYLKNELPGDRLYELFHKK